MNQYVTQQKEITTKKTTRTQQEHTHNIKREPKATRKKQKETNRTQEENNMKPRGTHRRHE